MSVDVYARNRGYGSTIGTHSPRPLTVGVRIGCARIQKRRSVTPCYRRLREVSSGCVPARGVRVERRAACTTGRKSFVSIHTWPTVTRDPPQELYRDVRDAYKILHGFKTIRVGKGLMNMNSPIRQYSWLS